MKKQFSNSETLRRKEKKGPGLRGAIVVALLALSGCASMAPEYTRPAAPVPANWPSGAAYKDAQPSRLRSLLPTSNGRSFL